MTFECDGPEPTPYGPHTIRTPSFSANTSKSGVKCSGAPIASAARLDEWKATNSLIAAKRSSSRAREAAARSIAFHHLDTC
jgi:hypothetical protein